MYVKISYLCWLIKDCYKSTHLLKINEGNMSDGSFIVKLTMYYNIVSTVELQTMR